VKAHVERLSKQEIDEPSDIQTIWVERYLSELTRLKAGQNAR
jgi:hypothetical protein